LKYKLYTSDIHSYHDYQVLYSFPTRRSSDLIKKLAGKQTEVHPITTEEYPVKALRPKYSVLNKSKIRNHFGIPIPGWQEGLKNCLKELGIFTNRESAD